ncbi:isoprenoid biosynthesis glyoxalase ElbB [Carboxylicivirga mesophila]|uniref:Isoprenoid biosynthesis glyoxalase ElbB n=1 Tax=Carboxylicivirga mesophila TaxID=1166478 RepID=A0ABS5KDN3_9BACT|nr:isoprenoid biosynthesis glyoxalase ElbB [Carboxylicivirga mesophila]MBS2212947.1 isoprenoid biosynthesis glyoxalase ElbB [Carboxylicivirga mesophila]
MTTKKQVAVILSGCGVYDGAEIHESVLSLLAIAKQGAEYTIFAPDVDQYHVINHLKGEPSDETRNVLVEAARIARGSIKPLSEYATKNFDALLLPGGFGAAKNLSTVAFDGPNCTVEGETQRAVKETHAAGKPIGALCIAPAVIAKILGDVTVTIGQDEGTAQAIEAMGGNHMTTNHGEVIVDEANKIATTPCYMLDANILQIAEGADNVVRAVLEMA